MGKRKRNETLDEVLLRPWCYYCDRDFDDLKILVDHQKAKHFQCKQGSCHRRLNTIGGLKVHMSQVHKEELQNIPNAKPDRDDVNVEIFGQIGVPQNVTDVRTIAVTRRFNELEREHMLRTGNPISGSAAAKERNEQAAAKKPKLEDESSESIKERARQFRAKKLAEKKAREAGLPLPTDAAAQPTGPSSQNGNGTPHFNTETPQVPISMSQPYGPPPGLQAPPPGMAMPHTATPPGLPGYGPPPFPMPGFGYSSSPPAVAPSFPPPAMPNYPPPYTYPGSSSSPAVTSGLGAPPSSGTIAFTGTADDMINQFAPQSARDYSPPAEDAFDGPPEPMPRSPRPMNASGQGAFDDGPPEPRSPQPRSSVPRPPQPEKQEQPAGNASVVDDNPFLKVGTNTLKLPQPLQVNVPPPPKEESIYEKISKEIALGTLFKTTSKNPPQNTEPSDEVKKLILVGGGKDSRIVANYVLGLPWEEQRVSFILYPDSDKIPDEVIAWDWPKIQAYRRDPKNYRATGPVEGTSA